MEAMKGVVSRWRSYSTSKRLLLVSLLVWVINVVYTNLTKNYINGKRTLKTRNEIFPFGLDVVVLHGFLGPLFDRGFGHLSRMTYFAEKLYGKSYGSRAVSKRVFIINDPEHLKYVLATNFSNYEKGEPFIEALKPFLGQGIFNSNGPAWKNQRNVAKVHFQREDINEMLNTFEKHGASLCRITEAAARERRTVDVQELFQRFTLDSVGDILFNYKFDTLNSESQFAKSFDYLQQVSLYRVRNPLWYLTAFLTQAEYDKHLKVVHELVENIVQACLDDENLKDRTDLLAHFVQTDNENGEPHSIPYLRDTCLNFLLAGRDTTASLLTWTLYCLSSHREVEKRLVEEIDSVIQGRDPTAEDLKNLRYMKLVLNEVLRLYPPVPMNIRTAVEDDTLPTGEFVPAGTGFVTSQFVLSRLTEFFGPDAEKFDPDRWSEERVSSIRPFYSIPFHAGPRICLGQQMALTEAKMVLVLLYQRFNIKQAGPNGQKIQVSNSLILTNKLGMNMVFTPRAQA